MCGGSSFLLIPKESSNPWDAVTPGFGDVDISNLLDTEVKQALLDDNFAVVIASDLDWGGSIQGAIVDLLTRSVTFTLNVARTGRIALASGLAKDPPAQPRARPELIVASARRQQLAFFDERDRDGNPTTKTYDFETATYIAKPYLGRYKILDPVSVAYRPEDDAYYLLDRCGEKPPRMCLYRVGLGWAPMLLAEWPRTGNFISAAITAGRDGTLILSGSNKSSHGIAILAVIPEGVSL
jgi:hypothetical protein